MSKITFIFTTAIALLLFILFLFYMVPHAQNNQSTNKQFENIKIEEVQQMKSCKIDISEIIKIINKMKGVEEVEGAEEIKETGIETKIDIETQTNSNDCMMFIATAYTKSVEEGTINGITASGTIVSRGTVSVDPKVIPLGTKLYVEGYGESIALDTGGAIKGNRIDLYMETKEEAFEWGRRQVKVWILE